MADRLLSSDLWPTVTKLARRAKTADVAVAWCAGGTSKMLPLPKGGLLVTDLSESAVRAGQTKPQALLPLLKDDVAIHSVRNLHAKVFVFDDTAIIGSSNVSAHSKNVLVEAAVLTTNRRVVAAARAFVRSLRGDFIRQEELKRLARLWRPPKFIPGGQGPLKLRGRSRVRGGPVRSPLWFVRTELTEFDEIDLAHSKRSYPKAKSRRRSRASTVSEFLWEGRGFLKHIREGDQIVQILEEVTHRKMVFPPFRIVWVHRYRRHGRMCGLIWLEEPRRYRRIELGRFQARIRPIPRAISSRRNAVRVRDHGLVERVLQAFPSPSK